MLLAVPRLIARQFALPQRPLGRLVGALMARTNAQTTAVLVEQLKLRGDETGLEIGYGPGIGIELLARQLTTGRIGGIDSSPVMRNQAIRRCRAYVDRVDPRLGTATELPWSAGTFDAVSSANSAQLWDGLEPAAREIAGALKPSGQLALALHQRAVRPDGTFVDAAFLYALDQALAVAGLQPVRSEQLPARGGRATIVKAAAPGQ